MKGYVLEIIETRLDPKTIEIRWRRADGKQAREQFVGRTPEELGKAVSERKRELAQEET
jgi:hypothetical protein